MHHCFSRAEQSPSKLNHTCLLDDCGTVFAAEPKAREDDGLRVAEGGMGAAGRNIWFLLREADGQAEKSALKGRGNIKRNLGEDSECHGSDVKRSGVGHSQTRPERPETVAG